MEKIRLSKADMERIYTEISAGLDVLEGKPELKAVIFENGYNKEDLGVIREHCAKVKAMYDEKESKLRIKRGLTAKINAVTRRLKREYNAFFIAYQRAYKHNEAQIQALGLTSRTCRRRGELMERAGDLFAKLSNDVASGLVPGHGLDTQRLEAADALIYEIHGLLAERQAVNGERKAARILRDKMLLKLITLWRAFEKNCNDWFKSNPEVLKGIFGVRTTPQKKGKDKDSMQNSKLAMNN